MGYTFFVNILHSKCNLRVYAGSLFFFDSLLFDNFFKQISSLGVLHNEVKFLLGLYDFVELDYEGMPKLFHDFKFSTDPDDIIVLKDEIFFEYFYCYI